MKRSLSVGAGIGLVLSVLVGLFLVVSGALILWLQPAADSLFDLHGTSTFESDPLSVAVGIRQLCLGLVIVGLAGLRQTKALGVVMVIGALVPLVDFLVFIPRIGVVSALRHGATVPFVLAAGILLLTNREKNS